MNASKQIISNEAMTSNFFNNYKKLLNLKTTQEIEKVFNKEMKDLGYL